MKKLIKITSSRGFTLVELLVSLTVLAILVGLAAPSFQNTIENNRISSINDKLATSLQYARSEAISRGQPVTVCVSSDQATCTGAWDDGWIVFIDEDGDRTVDGGDTLIRVNEAIPINYDIALTSTTTGSFQFDGQGFAPLNGTYYVCGPSDEDEDARGVLIRASGAMRKAVDTDSDDIREDHSGAALSC